MKFKSISKKILALACVVPMFAMANEGGPTLDKFDVNTHDLESLQRGAQTFANYCLSCHSAQAMRFNGLADIGIPDQQVKDNMLFAADKVTDPMKVALNPKEAKGFFGATPPDLSVIARARGADWLYTYLRSFYRDPSRPTGWNNVVFDKVGMPHVLWELQGQQVPKYAEVKSEHGEAEKKLVGLEVTVPGKMNKVEYDQAVADLVSYLDWMAEPAGNLRKRLGVWVLLFIGVFFVLAWRLNAAYWKDIK